MTLLNEEKRELLAEKIMAIAHDDTCYIFDAFEDGMLVASRAPAANSPQAESIRAYLDLVTWEEMRTHLLSYSPLPMVIDSRLGTGIVIPTLAPAASLGVLCIPDLPRDLLIRLAKSGVCGAFAFARSTSDIRARMSKRTTQAQPTFEAWMARVREIFYDFEAIDIQEPSKPIHEPLCRYIESLSCYLGCPLHVRVRKEIVSYGELDMPLLVAILLNVICLARRVATDRRAEIVLDMTSFGATIGVTMAKREECVTAELQELLSMLALAERKNILFDYAESEGMLGIRFSPVSKDWSYLELKAPDVFAWVNDQ